MRPPTTSTLVARLTLSDISVSNWKLQEHTSSKIVLTNTNSFVSYKQFSYPTFSHTKSDNELTITATFYNDTFTMQVGTRGCTIETTAFPELQLFYFASKDTLYVAETLSDLLSLVPPADGPPLDVRGVIDYCFSMPNLKNATLFRNIGFLAENQTLHWDGTKCKITQRNSLESQLTTYSHPVSLASASNKIASLIDSQLASLPTQRATATLSGGIDSAIVSHRASLQGCTNFVSLVLPTSDSKNQSSQLQKLQVALPGSHEHIPVDAHPLIDRETKTPSDPYDNPYLQLELPLIEKAQENGSVLVFTGIGGDDHFSIPQKEGRSMKKQTDALTAFKTFLSEVGQKHLVEHTTQHDATTMHSLVSPQVSSAHYSHSLAWKRAGIWPVSPFISKELVTYALHLPDTYLEKKKVLARYTQQELGLTQAKRDSFSGYFDRQFSQLLTSLEPSFFTQSTLYNSTLFDTPRLDTIIESAYSTNTISKHTKLFLFNFIRLELFLQEIYQK